MSSPYNTRRSKKTASTSPTDEEDGGDPLYEPLEPEYRPLKRGKSNNTPKRSGKKSASIRMPDLTSPSQLWSSDAALKAFEDGLVSSYASVGKADGIIVQRVFVGRSMPHSLDQVNNRIHNSKIPASLPSSVEKTETAIREWLKPLLRPTYVANDAYTVSLADHLDEQHALIAEYTKDKRRKTNLLTAFEAGCLPSRAFLPPQSVLPNTRPAQPETSSAQAIFIEPLPLPPEPSSPPTKKRMEHVICDVEVTVPSFGRKRCIVWGWYDDKFFVVVEPPLGASVSYSLERAPFRHLVISIVHANLKASLDAGIGKLGPIEELLLDNTGELFNTRETETVTIKLPNLSFPEVPLHNVTYGKDVEVQGTNGPFHTGLQVLCLVYRTQKYVPTQ